MKLEGVKVLDLSMFLPGPHLTMMMADHGAEVIRVEPPAGEPTRSLGASQNGMTVWFRNTHRNKQSVVLDLKQPAAVEAFLRLAASADVVVEAFRPGVVDRLGIGPKAVRAVNPRVVYCSISAFGQSGPLAQRKEELKQKAFAMNLKRAPAAAAEPASGKSSAAPSAPESGPAGTRSRRRHENLVHVRSHAVHRI